MSSAESSSDDSEKDWTKGDVRNFLIAYPTMVVVCAIWYSVGYGLDWIIG
ncbi:MAG: hypothetical protein HOI35_14610 [Woeseia sp.]|nr:hypothetical protein [Woeseia sp.]